MCRHTNVVSVQRAEPEVLLNNLLAEVRSASALLDQRDATTRSRLSNLETAVNGVLRQLGRPHGDGLPDTDERKSALGLLEAKHFARVTKHDGAVAARSPNLDQLRAFVEVVERGSFTAAAEELNLTQPAVTHQVHEPERRFKVELKGHELV